MWTLLLASMVHMINTAIMPAVNRIATVAFPQYSLASIQTVLSLTGIMMPCVSLQTAILIGRAADQEAVVVIGLFILG
jgi:hypothetical protein